MVNLLKKITYGAFVLRQGIRGLFVYPQKEITHTFSKDYDLYWKDKRAQSLGELSSWQKERADIILSVLKQDKSPESILDVGCGDGSILRYLGSQTGAKKLIGIDVSGLALEKAKSFGIEGIKTDGGLESFAKLSVNADYLLLLETLEHVPYSEEMLHEALGKARRGVFFSFPNSGYITHRLRFLFGRFPLQWRLHPAEHVRFWTKKDLTWWLAALGYKDAVCVWYRGVPLLNKLWPGLWAAGVVVYINKK